LKASFQIVRLSPCLGILPKAPLNQIEREFLVVLHSLFPLKRKVFDMKPQFGSARIRKEHFCINAWKNISLIIDP
jgi:hypothetical protein